MPPAIPQSREDALCLLLRALRRDKKMTQKQVALRLARPQSFVAKYEAGDRELSVIEWMDILEVLGASPGPFLQALQMAAKRKPKVALL